MFNWLMNHIFDREGHHAFQEEFRKFDELCKKNDEFFAANAE